jgi:CheY-like chemotaxis protein
MASSSVVILQTAYLPGASALPYRIRTADLGAGKVYRDGISRDDRNEVRSVTTKMIAIVDDEEDLLAVYKLMVRQSGFTVAFTASDGGDAVQTLTEKRVRPDVILLDYRMRTMNGLEAAQKIRQVDQTVKIVIVTADDSVKEKTIAAGFGYLQKPFSVSQLGELLKSL